MVKVGAHVERLTHKPDIEGLDFTELDYTPDVQVAQIREPFGPWRDMERAEIVLCDKYLAEHGPAGGET